ncbi:T9SS type A sorting domain-containing protein [Hymenobacter convexus]|uniref:T9SS type A sorting domain-containing protein n=1 Tax=Hymenobacter sp. CA1UV-4 TaxID=3063782 RepID=UPI002713220D|nr:T9SS type A sorting domain-containing protein [Hymenobacter sp. CA1UV-4]MDO7853622.1 T9SS type A sorting domain-containing protein [Hymenobacter sp. CA1UV-4]
MRCFYSFLLAVLLSSSWLSAAAQQLDLSFAPSKLTSPGGGVLTSLKQPDGKVLIAGFFQLMSGQPSPMVARLNADGSPDLAFRAQAGSGPNATVTALALQSDGKILVAGEGYLSGYNGATAQNIIRLNADGSRDTSFGSSGAGWRGPVRSMAVQADGKILVGGELLCTFDGQPTNGLVRLLPNGQRDTSFSIGTGFSSQYGGSYGQARRIIVQPDGNILVAGQFDAVNGQAISAIVRLTPTGARDATFTSPLTNGAFVFDMTRQADGKILVGGNTVTNRGDVVVRLLPSGAFDPAFAAVSSSGVIFSLGQRADGTILVSGSFSTLGGSPRNGVARLTALGLLDASFATGAGSNSSVMNIVELNSGQYLAVGFFNEFGGQNANGVARLLASGAVDTSYSLLLEYVASGGLVPQNNGQLVLNSYNLGSFNGQAVSNQNNPYSHRINADGSYNAPLLLPAPYTRPSGNAYSYNAFPQPDGTVYATYQNSDSTALVRRVLANGTFDAAFTAAELKWSRPYPPVGLGATITVHPGGGLLVSSGAAKVNGQSRPGVLARLNADGTLNTQFAPPTGAAWQVPTVGTGNTAGYRYAVGLANGQTLVVWNDATRSYVTRLNLDGTIDNSFSIGTGGSPSSLFSIAPLAGGKILVNGDFTTFNGQAAPYGLLRLLATGAPDPSFTAASAARSFTEQADGKLLVVAPGATSQTERLVRLTTTGSLDAGFQAVTIGNESFTPAAAAVYIQPVTNAIVLGGDFTSVAGQPRFGLARLVNTALAVRAATAVPLADVFPNPAHGQLNLRLPAPPTGPVLLTDLQGRTVRRWPLAQANGTVPLAGLAPGVYLLGIATAAGQGWQRVVVE